MGAKEVGKKSAFSGKQASQQKVASHSLNVCGTKYPCTFLQVFILNLKNNLLRKKFCLCTLHGSVRHL